VKPFFYLGDAAWELFHRLSYQEAERAIPNYGMIEHDYSLKLSKPCLDGETRYEDRPIRWNPENDWLDDHDVR
jgi:hypothetical protein